MKLLENSTLEALSSRISNGAMDCILDFKLEAYSCKMVQSDKKQWKNIEIGNGDRQPLSPPDDFLSVSPSPIGHSARMRHLSEPSCSSSDNDGDDLIMVDSVSLRTLFDLRSVLDNAFPDYDFSTVKSNSFSLIPSYEDVISTVNNRFISTVNDYCSIKEELWDSIEKEIDPIKSKIYGFKTTYGEDPFSEEGCIWSLNYLFYNKISSEASRKRKSCDSDSDSGEVKKFAMADFGFEYLDHPADIQLHAWGKTMERAMEQLVQSMYGYLIDDPHLKSVEETYEYHFEANGDDMHSLVFALLNEPLVAFQSEPFFIGKRVVIDSIDFEKFTVLFHVYGESYEIDKHKQGTDVKAITYSNMQITRNHDRSDLYVIIDI